MNIMLRSLYPVMFALALTFGGSADAAEQTVRLAVENMYCDACPYIVKQSLAAVPGVENVAVSFEEQSATVTYDDQKTTLDQLTSATAQAGYPSKVIE